MIAVPYNHLPVNEYLEWEEKQEEKHEYVNGLIYAMAGASENHVSITAHFTGIILFHLKGSKCKVFP